MNNDLLTVALAYAARSYSVHWLYPRSKHPVGEAWTTRPTQTPDDLQATYQRGYNVGVRCGAWSRPAPDCGLVVLDIDVKAPEVHLEPFEVLGRAYDGPVVDVQTGSGLGRHWWFRCPLADLPAKANTTLAKSAELVTVHGKTVPAWTLELLSTGKSLVVPPSIHPDTGQAYRWLTPYDTLPVLPEGLLDMIPRPSIPSQALPQAPRSLPTSADSIADAFRVVPWADILEPHGWQFVRQHGERQQWCRPGKAPRSGISATTIDDVLYCFSSSTVFEPERGYSKFAAYAVLEHGGDLSQAARALCAARRGRAA